MSKRKTTAILLTASLVLGGCGGNSSPKETEWNYESFMSELEESISAEQEYYRTYTPETTTLDVGYAGSGAFPETVSEEQPEEIIEEDVEAYIGEESDDNFTYDVYEQHAEVKKFIGKAGRELTIPDEYNGLPVTIIEANACDSNSSLTKLTIGANVEEIGYGAFSYDKMLLSVDFKAPENLKILENYSFSDCELLSSFPSELPSLEKLGGWAFERTSINEFIVSSGIKTISNNAFESCGKLKNIIIEEGVETIERDAFSGTGIETVIIPDSVTEIDSSAFDNCKELKEVSIGSGVKVLYGQSFSGLPNLEKLTLSDGLETIEYGCFRGCGSLKEIEIPASVKRISAADRVATNMGAFSECAKLETVTLREGLDSIEKYAFSRCESLPNIIIPNSVTIIGDFVFSNCNKLTEINIPGNVIEIKGGAFSYCDSLRKVNINEGVIKIGDAFDGNESLSVYLPNSLVQIDRSCCSYRWGEGDPTDATFYYDGKTFSKDQRDELFTLING